MNEKISDENVKITPQLVREHGLSEEEYNKILQILRREPTWVELGIFSVMWSEHASYKNSVLLLKTLPKEGSCLLTQTGEENAGVVDIGDGLAISFKIESHNHPSALEPYHGAATGVGGILRDIFTMGARPVAVLDSLRFGNPAQPHVKHLITEVVKGIADYGNCFGVPTVGGETYFDECYSGNPLVNVMAVGIVKHSHLAKSGAQGAGNLVVYVGAKTGRDGIHGATFASVELTEASEEKRTAVQVGDPFTEKLLMEATLEVIQKDLVVAIQDMGAAGLTCSSAEMAGKTKMGIEIDVAKVPQRETGMTPYEIMLSESQERMLVIVKPQNIAALQEVFHKWDLNAVVIGQVNSSGLLTVKCEDEIVAQIPAEYLVLGGKAPVYKREAVKPEYFDEVKSFEPNFVSDPGNYSEILLTLLRSPNISSKEKIYRQYDHMVQINTITEPGSDAAVIKIKGTTKALALSTDCNSRYCYLDPYEGAKGAVVEAARNVVCSGAKPLAITNCLNFGNPYKPEVYWTFQECIRGMSDACRVLETPVTGGNVSFYNENPQGAIYPTPVIGMVGLINDADKVIDQYFQEEGDLVYLIGSECYEIGGSEYLSIIHGLETGKAPHVDLKQEKSLILLMEELTEKRLLASAHDCSEGGLLVSLAECCFHPNGNFRGVNIQYEPYWRKDIAYFGETHGRIIVSLHQNQEAYFLQIVHDYELDALRLGKVEGKNFILNRDINLPVCELYQAWKNAII
ncbi:MAG TPA: phosphoribosylformylglycinamidine synthase subunit PurL [Candidatus Cloacimonadota bacterium]|nr:phosphoribosylformylglycinamidine synthase subunit PurL [Candidatus Cloacimonadota bacterium]